MSSLSGNLQRFGMERVAKVESLQDITAAMSETEEKVATAAENNGRNATGEMR